MGDPYADRPGNSEDRIITVMLDGQKEQREALIKQDERTRDLEEGYARISSGFTNLIENLTALAKSFKKHEDNQVEILGRIAEIERQPRLSATEITRLRKDQADEDALGIAQQKAGFDFQVSLKTVLVGALATFIVTLASAIIMLLAVAPHLTHTP